ncbi:hypothetical protein [Archangium sp.]|uniref:hypothetical protein n=1 Tax=Archangium sp. TaxID=1872627 RepID=UPI00286D09C5|nr:hypothetical protein [Archangium sp.]
MAAWMLATVASVALLAGCRNTTCQDLAEVYADVDKKSRPCLDGAPLAAFDASRCEQNLQQCEGDDLQQLDYQVDCYQKLAACQPEQKASFLEAVSDCDNHFISNTCEAAIFQAGAAVHPWRVPVTRGDG